jgi:hypothetical protein
MIDDSVLQQLNLVAEVLSERAQEEKSPRKSALCASTDLIHCVSTNVESSIDRDRSRATVCPVYDNIVL